MDGTRILDRVIKSIQLQFDKSKILSGADPFLYQTFTCMLITASGVRDIEAANILAGKQ